MLNFKLKKTDGNVVPHLVVPYTLDTNDMRFASAKPSIT